MQNEERHKIDRSELLATLDWEINDWETINAKGGWTKWAIILSMAGVLWLALEQLGKPIQFPLTLSVFIGLSLFGDLALVAFVLCRRAVSDYNTTRTEPRFVSTRSFSSLRGLLMTVASRSIALILASVFFGTFTDSIVHQWRCLLFYSVTVLLCLSMIGISFVEYDVDDSQKSLPPPSRVVLGLILGLIPVAIWGIYLHLQFTVNEFHPARIDAVKLGVLTTGLGYLACFLFFKQTHDPLLSSLRSLRQDLAFNRIDLGSAFHQADIVTAGRKLGDVFQSHLSTVLNLLEKDCRDLDEIRVKLEMMKELADRSTSPTNEVEVEKRDVMLQALMESCETIIERHKARRSEIDQAITKFNRKVYEVSMFSTRLDDNIKPLKAKISAGLGERNTEFEKLRTQAFALQEHFKKLGIIITKRLH